MALSKEKLMRRKIRTIIIIILPLLDFVIARELLGLEGNRRDCNIMEK
jgi:hypothetical protein